MDTISPTAVVDFGEGSGVQIFDLNTGKSVRVHQRAIASYHWLCSIDFHNVLDVSRTGVHVAWQGPFPQLFKDVKRALVRLHYICKRTNCLLFVHSHCQADSTCSRLFPTRVRHSLVKQVRTCFTSFASRGAQEVLVARATCWRSWRSRCPIFRPSRVTRRFPGVFDISDHRKR